VRRAENEGFSHFPPFVKPIRDGSFGAICQVHQAVGEWPVFAHNGH
jgi:hypothetical protein